MQKKDGDFRVEATISGTEAKNAGRQHSHLHFGLWKLGFKF